MTVYKRRNRGLIDTIVLIVIALIILGYFNIDLKQVFTEPLVAQNLKYALSILITGIHYVWETVRNLIPAK
jgi:hypothetical protein